MKRIACLIASVVMFMANAEAKPARCVVIGNGMTPYKGKCDFSADDGGGSFSITPT